MVSVLDYAKKTENEFLEMKTTLIQLRPHVQGYGAGADKFTVPGISYTLDRIRYIHNLYSEAVSNYDPYDFILESEAEVLRITVKTEEIVAFVRFELMDVQEYIDLLESRVWTETDELYT